MKKTNLLTLALAVLMVLALAIPALAADGSITVTNATIDREYNLYKVFDASYVTLTDGTKAIAYTYTGDDDFLAALQAATDVFEVNVIDETTNLYSVKSIDDSKVIDFINDNKDNLSITDTEIGAGETVEFTGLAYGYYFIECGGKTTLTITNALPTAEVVDKTKTPKPGPEDPEEPDDPDDPDPDYPREYKSIVDNDTLEYLGMSESIIPGETVTFRLGIDTVNYIGAELVTKYTAYDEMDDAFEIDADSFRYVYLYNDTETDLASVITKTVTSTEDPYKFNVVIPWAKDTDTDGTLDKPIYPEGGIIYIYYTATLKVPEDESDTDVKFGAANKNKAGFTWDTTETDAPDEPDDYDEVEVYSFTIDIAKVNAEDTIIEGATFKLYTDNGSGEPDKAVVLKDFGTNNYIVDKLDTTATVFEISKGGTITTVYGLPAGSYLLEEITPPTGYSKMAGYTSIVITDSNIEADAADYGDDDPSNDSGIAVINEVGGALPTTGGIGTTIFYVVGGVMVAAAVVLLITKKRIGSK